MARRINTPFVITLGAVLALIAAGVVGYLAKNYFQGRNPVYLKARAEEAEKAGNLEVALRFYGQATQRALESHAANAAELCMKVGNMAMQLSDQEKDRSHAESLYNQARRSWEAALGEDPRYLPARQKLVAEDYQWAKGSGSAASWTKLQENVQKLIELSPNDASGYAYRGEARLQLLLLGAAGRGNVSDTAALIEGDLKKAEKLDPKNPQPVVSMAQLMWAVEAAQAAGQNAAAAKKIQDQVLANLHGYLKENPNDPDVTIVLIACERQRNPDVDVTKTVEAAHAAHPENVQLANVLSELYKADKGKAEKVLRDAIATDVNNTGEYWNLADFLERAGELPEAIAAYKEMLQHPKPGGGIISFENDTWEANAKYQISSLYLDIAERDGVSTAAGQEAMKQAKEYVERFRAAKSDIGRQSVLDGRVQLLNDNVAQAITYLRCAEANLGALRRAGAADADGVAAEQDVVGEGV